MNTPEVSTLLSSLVISGWSRDYLLSNYQITAPKKKRVMWIHADLLVRFFFTACVCLQPVFIYSLFVYSLCLSADLACVCLQPVCLQLVFVYSLCLFTACVCLQPAFVYSLHLSADLLVVCLQLAFVYSLQRILQQL